MAKKVIATKKSGVKKTTASKAAASKLKAGAGSKFATVKAVAQKSSKSGGNASGKKTSKKAAGKAVESRKPRVAEKSAPIEIFVAGPGPRPIGSGGGASVMEIGTELVRRVNSGNYETGGELWSNNLVSVEGVGVSLAWYGMEAVKAKNEEWYRTHRVYGCSAEGPYVGATGFAVKLQMDVEDTQTGGRGIMTEIAVYTVREGKIAQEEFMYSI